MPFFFVQVLGEFGYLSKTYTPGMILFAFVQADQWHQGVVVIIFINGHQIFIWNRSFLFLFS